MRKRTINVSPGAFLHDVVLDDVRDPDARRELLAAFTNLIDSEFLPTEQTEAPE